MSDARWEDGQRLESWAGELRVNLLRSLGLIVFYSYHLVNVYLLHDETITPTYHQQVGLIFFLWAVLAAGLYHTLIQRYVPVWLKFTVVGLDLALVTLLCLLHPDGPRSTLMLLYFVVIASSPLRLSLPLVQVATLGTIVGAGLVLVHRVYFHPTKAAEANVSTQSAILFVLCLITTGLFVGQLVRQSRRLLEGYAVEVHEVAQEVRQ